MRAIALGSGMGTGMTVGSLCGAVNAAAMIVGYIKGRESNENTNEARGYARELMSKVDKVRQLTSFKTDIRTYITYLLVNEPNSDKIEQELRKHKIDSSIINNYIMFYLNYRKSILYPSNRL